MWPGPKPDLKEAHLFNNPGHPPKSRGRHKPNPSKSSVLLWQSDSNLLHKPKWNLGFLRNSPCSYTKQRSITAIFTSFPSSENFKHLELPSMAEVAALKVIILIFTFSFQHCFVLLYLNKCLHWFSFVSVLFGRRGKFGSVKKLRFWNSCCHLLGFEKSEPLLSYGYSFRFSRSEFSETAIKRKAVDFLSSFFLKDQGVFDYASWKLFSLFWKNGEMKAALKKKIVWTLFLVIAFWKCFQTTFLLLNIK